jgi:imidazolonepropionase
MWDALWRNGKLATTTVGAPFGLIEGGAVAAQDGRIAWVGVESALPGEPATCTRAVHDLTGRLFDPGRHPRRHDRGGQGGGEAQGPTIGGAR